jgi:hypothetical protein
MASERVSAIARRGGPVFVACVGLFALTHPAAAQINLPPSVGTFQGLQGAPSIGPGQAPPTTGAAARPPPVGLPGAQPKAAPAPPTTPPIAMSPTDELFDAINRGDLSAAQDAVGRGADLNGHNVLGMTPVQLSIDLGRNDITFLLLAAGGGGAATPQSAAGTAQILGKGAGNRKVARNAEHRPVRVMRAAAASASPPPMQTPRLFAGNGGAPIPSAGFLGFDPGR